jgi:hypothetical protein
VSRRASGGRRSRRDKDRFFVCVIMALRVHFRKNLKPCKSRYFHELFYHKSLLAL